jgi:competence protein ComEA
VYRVIAILSLALLTVFVVAAGVVLLLRQDDNAPIQVLAPAAVSDAAASPSGLGTPAALRQAGAELRVYINGAVQRPGVYTLQPGDRLVEALASAGGALPEADLAAVNLARRVQDEGYYYIPRAGEKLPPAAESVSATDQTQTSPAPGPVASRLIDLNTAPASALETLPGIGAVRAQAIVDDRTQNGPFRSPQDITRVSGIGPITYEKIQHLITVAAGP